MNLFLVIASAVLVIAADALIKVASNQPWGRVFQHKAMLASYAMYFIQIVLAVLIFRSKGELAVYTNLFVVFYSLAGVLVGCLAFHERLTVSQWVGIAFAATGAYLLLGEHNG